MGQYHISQEGTVLDGGCYTGDRSARMIHEDGRPYGTFRSYTMLVDADRAVLKNLEISNLAGPGEEAGQAIALYADGDGLRVENCRLSGHQDTLFCAPLPPRELVKDGFVGPKQFEPRKRHTMYFKDCLIEGGVDFVFGGATVWFENCEFRSIEPGYVFAPSTPEGVEEGFVCQNCRFTRGPGVPDESCYLGRPWRNHGKVRLEDCFLDRHIKKEGWHDWGKTEARATVSFVELRSFGPGAENAARPDWVEWQSGRETERVEWQSCRETERVEWQSVK